MNRRATERADMARMTVAPPFTKSNKNVDLIFILKPQNTVAVKYLFYLHRRINSVS